MPKVAVVTDNHAGVRSNSAFFFDVARDFYRDVFFPKIDELGIKTVVHLGDLVEHRKYAAFLTLHRLRQDFTQPLLDRGLELIITPGNHDIPYRERLSVNAEDLVLPRHPLVRVVDRPQVWMLYDLPVLLLPWVCDENREASLALIRERSTRVAMGHLELAGFVVDRSGRVHEGGMDARLFDGYDLVLSGHYHHASQRGPVRYLGSPFQTYWTDYDDPRGFHVFDTETLELEFIENPRRVFEKYFYPSRPPWCSFHGDDDAMRQYVGKIVKLVVQSKDDPAHFDRVVEQLESVAESVQVVDDHKHADVVMDESVLRAGDTLDVLASCVSETELQCDKGRLSALLTNLYREAEKIE